MTVEAHDQRFHELVAPDTELERLAGGFAFIEGPVWHPSGYLLFCDIPNNARLKWTEKSGVEEVLSPSNECNGMTLDRQLNLVVCEHYTRSVLRVSLKPDGTERSREVLASHFDDKELNSPNDVIVKSDGAIYFTDPTYGRLAEWNVRNPAAQELDFQGVFRIAPTGAVELVASDFLQPNGLCFSPDESILYVNDTEAMHVRRFAVESNGELRNLGTLATGLGSLADIAAGFPDGMKCDEHGNVWVTGPSGIWIFAPAGEHLGTILVPELVGNFAWGGRDWDTIYVTAKSSLYRFPALVGGDPGAQPKDGPRE